MHPERFHIVENQHVDLTSLNLPGRILDIGGGGEGIIGRLFGERVVAVDPVREELLEAPDGPLKVVMDARKLGFLDSAFDSATSFFCMMYVANQDHEQVVREVHRVLKPGSTFMLWDVTIPAELPSEKQAFMVQLQVTLPGTVVRTGYAVRSEGRHQEIGHFVGLARSIGFEVEDEAQHDHLFSLRLKKT